MRTLLKQIVMTAAMAGILILGSVTAAFSAQHTSKHTARDVTSKKEMSLLFVLSAKSGAIKKTSQGYTLILNHVNPKMLWFTDRPAHKAGFIKTRKFIQLWPKDFKGSPPNAALVHVGLKAKANGVTEAIAIELKSPTIRRDGSIIWQLGLLNGDKLRPETISDVNLFVDDMDTNRSLQFITSYYTFVGAGG